MTVVAIFSEDGLDVFTEIDGVRKVAGEGVCR